MLKYASIYQLNIALCPVLYHIADVSDIYTPTLASKFSISFLSLLTFLKLRTSAGHSSAGALSTQRTMPIIINGDKHQHHLKIYSFETNFQPPSAKRPVPPSKFQKTPHHRSRMNEMLELESAIP